jgi:hypothetical protein
MTRDSKVVPNRLRKTPYRLKTRSREAKKVSIGVENWDSTC